MTAPDAAAVAAGDDRVRAAIYAHFAAHGVRPSAAEVGESVGIDEAAAIAAFRRLQARRMLALDTDGRSIRMAPPFSGVPTQHVVDADGIAYYANCAWDALGIAAALHKPAIVHSRCEESLEPLELPVGLHGPGESDWLFHCLVPAARWWQDIVFT